MMRGLSQLVGVIACAWIAWQPPAAFAQDNSPDEDTQLWVYAVAQSDLDKRTQLTVDGSARWREVRRGDEQQTGRFSVMRDVGEDGFSLGGGFGVFEAEGGATELRPHQQLGWKSGRWSARTRLEQRFFDGADRMELRFRQRIRYTQPLGKGLSASLDGEYFNLVQTRNRTPDPARDQWRGRLIVSHRLSEELSIGASYLFIFTPQPIGPDQINHVPQLIVTRRF